jgi:16S rRNA (cytosine1402-N4)-methyltransferase
MALPHQPVLYKEIIHALRPKRGGRYLDGTLGAAGHASRLLEASAPDGQLLGLDVDPQALKLAHRKLAPFGERARLIHASYATLRQHLDELGWDLVDGIILDLGASSMQFDSPERGFSFLADGPLDMRFDPTNQLTAAQIVNEWPEEELANVIYRYGEEPASRRIARAIVQFRPIIGTGNLAAVIERVQPRRGPHHPATQTFQALRIAVNGRRFRRRCGRSVRVAGWQSFRSIRWRTGLLKNSSGSKAGIASARPSNRFAPAGTRQA